MMEDAVIDLTLDDSDDEVDEGITYPSQTHTANHLTKQEEINESVTDDDARMQEVEEDLPSSNKDEAANPSIAHALLIDDNDPEKVFASTATRPSNYNEDNERDLRVTHALSSKSKQHYQSTASNINQNQQDQPMPDARHETGESSDGSSPVAALPASAAHASKTVFNHDSPMVHASFVMPSDPLCQDPYLSPNQTELVYLAEESKHSLYKPEPDWDFLYFYASAALRIVLRRHKDWQACEEFEFLDRTRNDQLVQRRYHYLRQSVSNALSGGYRRPLMRAFIRELRMRNRKGFLAHQSFPVPEDVVTMT